ncbi:signal peptide-containing protein [Theileria equi strain WA]|uniref:Signal peptide-containing protein n=1 Tax=Theileria equi strain WA TaxID=1537102 RepID=L0AZI9_THEEQ|nr:signal peptide-containing protein [Theileria equi strain WA]AFZ81007.1 signal peptide-containing protein [Theileria equi strain WA]|eukprot:XP_004830673.1 signal peptide-containing protein [Theileria equi strain WA]
MNVFSVLWTVCLVGVCRCGGDSDAKGALKGGEKRNPSESTDPENSLVSKVDTSLFDVESSFEDNVKVLKLKAKEGVTANKLRFDGQTFWTCQGPSDACLSAILYFGESGPIAATYSVKGRKVFEGYRKFADGTWTSVNKEGFNELLEELKKDLGDAKKSDEDKAKHLPEVNESKEKTTAKQKEYPEDISQEHGNEIGKENHDLSDDTHKENPTTPLQPTVAPPSGQTANSDQKTTESAKRGQGVKVKPVESPVPTPKEEVSPQDNGTSKPVTDESQVTATPITLDLTKPDETKLDVHTETESGVSFKGYSSKDAFHISSVVEGRTSVWRASGDEKCVLAKLSSKGDSSLLLISLESGYVYFEKNGSNWKEIKQDEFNGKLATLMGETLDLSNPDTSKILVHTETKSEVTVKYHYPKDTSKDDFHISSVMDGEVEVWTCGTGETSGLVNSYTKGSSLLLIGVDKGDDLEHKYFGKVDGKWREVTLKEFLKEFYEMKGLPKASK